MELQDIETAIRDRMGISSTDGLLDQPTLERLINRALQVFSKEDAWPWLEHTEALVSADPNVVHAADLLEVLSVRVDTIPHNMIWISVEMCDRLSLSSTPANTVSMYGFDGTDLLMRPPPAGSTDYTLRYIRAEPDLTGPTSEPLVPDANIEAIIEYTAGLGFRQIRNVEQADLAMGYYHSLVERYKGRLPKVSDSQGGGQIEAPNATR